MYDKTLSILTILATVGSGLIAGVFFIFSVAIMPALARVTPDEGINSMKSINVVIVNPIFLFVFLGTAIFCFMLAIMSVFGWSRPGSGFLLAGALFYLVAIVITAGFNIPMNNALDKLTVSDPQASTFWAKYLSDWTLWNHLRSLATLASTGLLIWAARSQQ